jgi:hypothetical protein
VSVTLTNRGPVDFVCPSCRQPAGYEHALDCSRVRFRVVGPKCHSCRYSVSWGPGFQCRRHAPGLLAENTVWPFVQADDWCGDFEGGPA